MRQLSRNRRARQFRNRWRCGVLLYSGIVKGENSAMASLAEDVAGTNDAELDHSCFVPHDGAGWTLNAPSPRSNGWRTSHPFPTPGHSARATSQRRTGGTMRHCLTVRGFASGSRTVSVADLQIQASPYQNPAASPRIVRNPLHLAISSVAAQRQRRSSYGSAFTFISGCEFSRLAESLSVCDRLQHLRWPADL